MLKIKDNVDHVGHSLPPVVYKLCQKYHMETFNLSQNNNLLTAQVHTETKAVMVG